MQSQSTASFSPRGTAPDLAVLRVYRWIGSGFLETIVRFDGQRLSMIEQGPAAPAPEPVFSKKLDHFAAQRLSLFDSQPLRDGSVKSPLVTVGIRGIDSINLDDGKDVTVKAWVFCFFGLQKAGNQGLPSTEQVLLGLKLKVEGQTLILDQLTITDVDQNPTPAKLAARPPLTKAALDATANLAFELKYTGGHFPGHFLTKSVGLKLDMADIDKDQVRQMPWVLRIDFPKMQEYFARTTEVKTVANFRTIRFEVDVHHYARSQAKRITLSGFPDHSETCASVPRPTPELSASDFDFSGQPQFTITQRAPTSAMAIPEAPRFDAAYVTNTCLLHVRGVPGKIVPDQWNARLPEYQHALDEVLGGRPISFVPELSLVPGDRGGSWVLTYQIEDRWMRTGALAAPPSVFRALSLHLQSDNATLLANLSRIRSLNNESISGLTLSLRKSAEDALEVFEFDTGIVLRPRVPLAIAQSDGGDPTNAPVIDANAIRMGALDIELDNRGNPIGTPNAVYRLQLQPESCRTTIHLNAEIAVKRVLPGGQDDPDGEEYVPENQSGVVRALDCSGAIKDQSLGAQQQRELQIEARFRRTRPLVVVPNRGNQPVASFVLRVTEDVEDGRTQTIALEVAAMKAPNSPKGDPTRPCDVANNQDFVDVVVLDHDPFLVAKVRAQLFTSPSLFTGNAIASWSNASAQGPSWQLRSDNNPFCLILPPQGVGEEMQKDATTISDGELVKYAFTPPGRLELKANLSPANFAEAPWNLRRLLGIAGEPQIGPVLRQLQYELLYGLFCGVRPQGLQVADIFSRVGRIAPRRAPEMRWTASQPLQVAYRASRLNWANIYRRYLSRVAVLEPWKPLESQSPVLKEGLICTLRTDVLANPIQKDSPGLKGGALWGIESLNIYSAVKANPKAGTAELAGAAFSALGAWGHQKATFNNDLTLINADVAMGRVYRYKTERLGRIGVWWNLAKHVIVYERTVTPSRQFFGEQSVPIGGKLRMTNMGRPMLRKIREYVEILEETRSYPDGPNDAAQSTAQIDAARRRPGFVASCSFPKGAQYNVLGSWGGDVTQGDPASPTAFGWKVPLWHAGASPSDVYPKPKVTLGLHARSGNDPVIVPGEIDEPENLYFFTLTMVDGKDPNKDPHTWDPFPDVDYSLLPVPKPPTGDFTGGSLSQTLPDEVPVMAGFGCCTFRLVPAALPSNLTQDRSDKALSAIVKTVTMVRAVNTDTAVDAKIQQIEGITSGAAAFVQKVITSIPSEPIHSGGALPADIAKLLKDNIEDPASKVKKQLNDVMDTLATRLADLENDFFARLNKAIETARTQIQSQLDKDFDAANTDVQAWKANLQTAVVHRVEDAIALLETSCGAAQRLILGYVEAAMALANLVQGGTIRKSVEDLKQRAQSAKFKLLAIDLELARQIRDVQSRLKAAGQRRPIDWLPDPAEYIVNSILADPFKRLDTFLSAIDAAATNTDQALKGAAITIQKFDVDSFVNSQVTASGKLLASVTGDSALTDAQAIATAIEVQGHAFETWQQKMMSQAGKLGVLTKTVQDLLATATDVNSIRKPVKDAVDAYFADVESDLTQNFKRVLDKERAAAMAFLKNASTSATARLESIGQNLLDTLKKQIPLDEMQKQITQLGNDIAQRANDFYDKNFRSLLPPGFTPAKIENTTGKAARLLRALGEPPQVPNLDFPRSSLGYYFQDDLNDAAKRIGITPVLARVNQAQDIANQANALLQSVGVTLPTTGVLDSLIPATLKDFKLSSIFPDFAGLKLSNLFSGLNLPDIDEKNVTITHDIDPQSRRAIVKADVNFALTEGATVFSIGPLVLQMLTATFTATARVEAQGTTIRRSVSGLIHGNWQVSVGGLPVVLFNSTDLRFDDSTGVRFEISPANIQLPGVMSFVNDLLTVAKTGSDSDGLSIGPIENGYQCVLSLPIPDIQGATTGISNLTLGARLALLYAPQFQFLLGFFLARKEAPFSLTVFVLGGGGYLECDATYTPDTGKLTCRVDLAVTASASLAIALGPIKGGVYVYLGVTASFRSGGGNNGLTIGAILLVRGNVDILGIVTACVSLLLEATYENSHFTARGQLSISIKICWCFTLSIQQSVQYSLGGSGGSGTSRFGPTGPFLAQAGGGVAVAKPEPGKYARQYTRMLV